MVPDRGDLQVHGMIERRAARHPEALAICDGTRHVSYGELNRWANRIAHRLLRLGVVVETPVAVLVGRSAAAIAGQLGVLKAGGCFVALDADHPAARIRATIAASGARILLVARERQTGHGERRTEVDQREVDHCIDLMALAAGGSHGHSRPGNPRVDTDLANLAYIIHTSGSTGEPKGVEVTHGNLLAFMAGTHAIHSLVSSDRGSNLASLAFDAAVWEIWPFLVRGASIHICDRETVLSPARLVRWLARHHITLCFATTALCEALLAQRWPSSIALRSLLAGGERLRLFAPSDLPCALYNHYGPTECTVFTTESEVPRAASSKAEKWPSIGRPLDHLYIRLLAPSLREVGPAESGEMTVGGAAIARGYRGRPALTAEAWVPDAAGAAGSRLYRTGDLARRRANGELDFLGRIDNQVKIRGFRVEPGEVEAVLMRHPSVAQAVVVVVDTEDAVDLSGFVTAAPGEGEPTAELLRSFLAARLPAAMVPARLTVREALPLTSSLKVDRKALARAAREPERTNATRRPSRVETEDETTEAGSGQHTATTLNRLSEIFAEVLGLETVATDDDFLELGGHSLLITRVCSRVRRSFGVALELSQLYDTPSVRLLAPVVKALVEASGGNSVLDGGVIEPFARQVGGELPLSFAQERLWFLDRLLEASAVYNVAFGLELRGPLVPSALAAAWADVLRRHEGLRVFFLGVDGQPVQKALAADEVGPAGRLLPTVDLSGCPQHVGRRVKRKLGELFARRPFQLDRPPLYRLVLLKRTPRRHTVLANMHHILCDGWSLAVLLGDLAVFYGQEIATSREAVISTAWLAEAAPAILQAADYAAWQRHALAGEVEEAQLRYWRAELESAPPRLELPTDRPRPNVESTAGGRVAMRLDEPLSERLGRFSRRVDSSLYSTLFAALAVLLGRLGGVSDLVLGCPIANRQRLDAEELVGFLVNTLPVRAELVSDSKSSFQSNLSFLGLVAQVNERVMAAQAHQDLPFERLVEEFSHGRTAGLNPLVSVLFVMQNAPSPPTELASGLAMEYRELETAEAIAELSVIAEPRAGGVEVIFDYRTELWDATTMVRLAQGFRRLLSAAVARPELALVELPLISPAERHQLTREWNDTAWTASALTEAMESLVHHQVEANAQAAPQAVALVSGAIHLTYGELDRRAEELARGLRRIGVAAERRVGLWLDRSPELVVAMLAVLKAGGAFVPLDPIFPDRRGDEMLCDADALAVIFRTGRRRVVQRFRGSEIELDGHGWRLATRGAAPLEPATSLTPANLAYVIFTSGSTGKPKGVAVAHQTLSNLVAWYRRAYALDAEDRSSAMSGPAFDALVFETWPILATGGRLEMVSDALRASPVELAHWIEARALTVSWLPTPLAEAILATGLRPGAQLRCLQTAGDRLHRLPRSAAAWPLYNNYGPTEATVCSSWGAVSPDPTGREPSIGRPILGTRTQVLVGAVEVAAIGMPGELCIGGGGVVRGYLGRPRRTALAFVPDAFADLPGARLYRSGDLARLRADGQIEFLGRVDQQVKVRGFRIELGEIESCLADLPKVEAAVVVVVGEGGGRRLVAMVVAGGQEAGQSLSSDELALHLGRRLPEYMVPASFIVLDRLPTTPSGKVDTRLLTTMAEESTLSTGRGGPPATPVEIALARIWSQLLAVEGIGRDDDFFRLGGHSLVAVQAQSRIQISLGVDLPLREILKASSLAALAKRVEELAEASADGGGLSAWSVIPRRSPGAEVAASSAQARLWFLDRFSPGEATYNVPLALNLAGPLVVAPLAASLAEIQRRHESVRTVFETRDGEPFQVIQPPSLKLPVVDLSALPPGHIEAAVTRLGDFQGRQPMDLAKGPLMRQRLLRLGVERHCLLITFHHITCDGWSNGVVLEELRALYPAMVAGLGSPLPELPIQYGDFSLWQRDWLASDGLEPQLDFWRRRMAELPPTLHLPTDRPRSPVRTFAGGVVRRPLDGRLGELLSAFCGERGLTPFAVLQAAFSALLGRYAQQERFATGFPVANRRPAQVETLIGFFVNTLVFVSELAGAPSFSTLLERTDAELLEVLTHQDLPFDRLVEELGMERDMSHSPLFDVMLSLESEVASHLRLAPELVAEVEELHPGNSRFDLCLTISREAEVLRGEVEYATDLFDPATASRFLSHFETLLSAALASPEEGLWALPLLSEPERAQLHEWERPREWPAPLPSTSTVIELFAAQAVRQPGAVALIVGDERLRYGELLERVERLSRRLVRAGLKADEVAAILLPRGVELIVAMLSVHAAGGAYLALDMDYPSERSKLMLEDSGAILLLIDGELTDCASPAWLAPGELSAPLAVIEVNAAQEAAQSPCASVESALPPSPGNLSHLIYTSGSTGRPKGVAISLASTVAMVRWAASEFPERSLRGVLASTSVCFDLSVFEIFVPLCCGGTVILADNALALPALAARDEVTLLNTVPSALAALLRLGGLPAGIKTVNLAGEALPARLTRDLYEQPTVERVYNLYGPSEDTTYSTFERVEPRPAGPPPIGRTIAGSSAYVVDDRLRRVAQGAPGELLLGGAGLARGYLGQPGLTAASFVPDSLSGESGRRLYRTGDRVRWRDDGRLDFLGRLDHQVKLRGFRIELGEVESALRRCRNVREAAVGVRAVAGEEHLVGWLAEESVDAVELEELRGQLSAQLPAYMVPSAFLVVERLPLTANGKLNREALPDPGENRLSARGEFVGPSTPLEELVAQLWSEALGFERISVDESFFKLGGHSLAATRVVARLEELFGLEVPLRLFFEAPTIEGLVAKLGELEAREAIGPGAELADSGRRLHAAGGGR